MAQIAEEAASHTAIQVVRNVSAMRDAIELLGQGAWEHEQIEQIHHAQFETVHPFGDGNGRVGRALVHGVLKRAGLVEGGVVPLSTALRNDERGYVEALTGYRYDGTDRGPALNDYVRRFLSYVEIAVGSAERFVDAATSIHRRWQAAVAGIRIDSSLHRAVAVVVETPVISARFLAGTLEVSDVTAGKLIKQLEAVGILAPATGKHRRSSLYQADDILNLLAFGAEAGPRAPAPGDGKPDADQAAGPELLHRCGQPTAKGPCRNRVPEAGRHCWRHHQ